MKESKKLQAAILTRDRIRQRYYDGRVSAITYAKSYFEVVKVYRDLNDTENCGQAAYETALMFVIAQENNWAIFCLGIGMACTEDGTKLRRRCQLLVNDITKGKSGG